jgi:hypothetical protein
MVKTVLVESDIEDGRRLLGEMDRPATGTTPISVSAALWLYTSESLEWRLLIATPLVEEKGPRAAYSVIQKVLRSLKPPVGLALQNISVVKPSDILIRSLRKAIQIGPRSNGVRFARNMVGGTYIEDSYIYRLPTAA